MHPKTYAYGFCLAPAGLAKNLPPSFRRLPLSRGFELHYDSRRPLQRAEAEDGTIVLVHGRAYYLGEDTDENLSRTKDAAARLADALNDSESAFLECLDLMAGRHLILVVSRTGLWIYHDAVGSRSVYYMAGGGGAASHAHLLASTFGLKPSGVVKASHTWDLSPFTGGKALPPNHRIEVLSGQIERHWPFRPNPWIARSEEDRLVRVQQLWHRQMELVARGVTPLRFALSGGADSRCVLALSLPWLSAIPCFTYGGSPAADDGEDHALNGDVRLVRPLVDLLGLDHRVIYRADKSVRPLTPEESLACDRNSLGVHGRWLLPHYLTNFSEPDLLVVRGNAFEIAQHKWAAPEDTDVVAAVRSRLVKRATATGVQIPKESLADHFDRSLETYLLSSDLHGYIPSDLTHWEYRNGRWASEVYNEIDLAFDTHVPIGARAILEPLLAFSRRQRAESYAFGELINSTVPVLNFFGMSDTRNLYEVARDTRLSAGSLATEHPGPARPAASVVPSAAVTEEPWPMDHPLIVRDPSGREHAVAVPEDMKSWSAYVPLENFIAGTQVHRTVHVCTENGDLFFDMHKTWSGDGKDRSFSYSVTVDDRVVLTLPGAYRVGRIPIAVHDVRCGQRIRLCITVHKARDRLSWQNATRIQLSHLRFDPGGIGGGTPTGTAPGLPDVDSLRDDEGLGTVPMPTTDKMG